MLHGINKIFPYSFWKLNKFGKFLYEKYLSISSVNSKPFNFLLQQKKVEISVKQEIVACQGLQSKMKFVILSVSVI